MPRPYDRMGQESVPVTRTASLQSFFTLDARQNLAYDNSRIDQGVDGSARIRAGQGLAFRKLARSLRLGCLGLSFATLTLGLSATNSWRSRHKLFVTIPPHAQAVFCLSGWREDQIKEEKHEEPI